MTLDELKTKVGSVKWSLACVATRKRAPKTGEASGPPLRPANTTELTNEESAAFSEVSELVVDKWLLGESNEPHVTRVKFLIDLYREMPSYHFLLNFQFSLPYVQFSQAARNLYWDFIRDMLSSDDPAMGDPVAYDLWCGAFEDPKLVSEAWEELMRGQPQRRLLERVLLNSGPVPFALKRDLFSQLIEDQSWHFYIYRSLLHSNFDVYGEIDRFVAREILKKLSLPPETEHLKDLESALGM